MAVEITVSEHLRKIPPAVRPTVRAARRTVKAVAPKAKEITYRSRPPRSNSSMWKIARYVVDDEQVVAIGTYSNHASLFFFRGREIDDRSGLLRGAGKELRYVTLRAPADADRPAVRRILRRAFRLASG